MRDMNPEGNRRDRTRRMYNLHLIDDGCCIGGMPQLDPVDVRPERLIDFTAAPRREDRAAGVHFYLDDFKFGATWKDPLRYIAMLSRFACALTPDFSCYVDMPEPMQRWNVYRGRAVGVVWQAAGLVVVPTLTWGYEDTFDFVFEGVPQGSTVAVSTVGLAGSDGGVELFMAGASEAARRLHPRRILAYGRPLDFDSNGAEVVWYASEQQERFARLREQKRKEVEDGQRL